nr:uncharacterized protein LOC100184146 [Ciona intestinalis]|eukprot:XP_018667123.2 uncharacterized protein LOC100184146 [Ciona intestinalis]
MMKTISKIGKKDKKKRKKEVDVDPESDEVKEVLQLFNKIEEMVVDGDPRIRVALNKKPAIQTLLRDDSSMYGLSPRSMIVQDGLTLAKEATNNSLLSNRQYSMHEPQQTVQYNPIMSNRQQMINNNIPLSNRNLGYLQTSPRKTYSNLQVPQRNQRRHILVPPITIPEHSAMEDTADEYQDVRRHPDGTLVTLNNTSILEKPPAVVQPVLSPKPKPKLVNNQVRIQQQQQMQQQVPRKTQQRKIEPRFKEQQFHSFNYNSPQGKSNVQMVFYEEQPEYKEAVQNEEPQYIGTMEAEEIVEQPVLEPEENKPLKPSSLNYRSAVNRSNGTESFSKVVGKEGGRITCFGCSVDIPKNAIEEKCLFRLSILDVSQIPHQLDRVYHWYDPNFSSAVMAISPAVRIDPSNAKLLKPVTVKLPTCIAVEGQKLAKGEETMRAVKENSDIEVGDISIKKRDLNSNEVWVDFETETFRSSDSVSFNLQQLGDVCAFHNSNDEEKSLNKRLSLFAFKSMDRRKNQFLSILICEDLPHVVQKGIESMPHWLAYTDSCFNVIMKEGMNVEIFVQPKDRSLCHLDANKLEIPWENLWHPECIVRKHIRVTLLTRETETHVQLLMNEGEVKLDTAFVWQVKYRSIHLPDLMTTDSSNLDYATEDKWETEEAEKRRLDHEMYKRVTWKPATPVSKFITNKGLLNYATM